MARRANWELVCMAAVLVAGDWRCCADAFAQYAAAGDTVVLFVDDDAQPGGDGFSWDSAHRTLQDALMFAHSFGADEIRVAQGVYKPDQGGGQTPGDRNATFSIPSGLALRGGYAGLTGDDPDAQDWAKYETRLTGDLLGNDGPAGSFQNYGDNSFHVVAIQNNPDATLQGLVISAGSSPSSERGGGLFASQSVLHLDSCTFIVNRSQGHGGGASLVDCNVTVAYCTFHQNRCTSIGEYFGGGLDAISLSGSGTASIVLMYSVFTNNSVLAANGGGFYSNQLNVHISHCTFANNGAGNDGGAMAIESSPPPPVVIVEDSLFVANFASDTAGAIVFGNNIVPTLIRCRFLTNGAGSQGGAVRLNGVGHFIECDFDGNGTTFSGGAAWQGGGILVNCMFTRNTCGAPGSPGGGAARAAQDTEFVNCVFNGNSCLAAAGGVFINPANGPLPERIGWFRNCTLVHNQTSTGDGGAIVGKAFVNNSILVNNVPAQLQGAADVDFSCITGGWPGQSNIDADPLFVDPLGPDGVAGTSDDILRLESGSPCVDAGDNNHVPKDNVDIDFDGDYTEPIPLDIERNPRFRNDPYTANTGIPSIPNLQIVDMGAFEHQPVIPADINGDLCVNVPDLLAVIDAWGPCVSMDRCPADIAPSNGDGVVDKHDLLQVIIWWGCY